MGGVGWPVMLYSVQDVVWTPSAKSHAGVYAVCPHMGLLCMLACC